MSNELISIALILVVSGLLIVTGLRKQPGLGIIGAVLIIGLSLWLRGGGLRDLGFGSPANWGTTILLSLVLGLVIQLLSVALIEPLSDRVTRSTHDHSVVENVKGNWKALLQWLLVVWVFVALLEEAIYRGFLMTEFANVAGRGAAATALNVIFTSAVFGLSHGYQGRSGILSTGIIGALLGILFVWSGFNLWLPILTHGIIDTVGIGLIAADKDKTIRQLIWKSSGSHQADNLS